MDFAANRNTGADGAGKANSIPCPAFCIPSGTREALIANYFNRIALRTAREVTLRAPDGNIRVAVERARQVAVSSPQQ
jgi:hypothetical protein